MRYVTKDLINQMIDTLKKDSMFADPMTVKRHAGEVNAYLFNNPTYWQGVIAKIPFVLIKYQGRIAEPYSGRKDLFTHTIDFCAYVGTKSMEMESGVQACEDAEVYLAKIHDLWNGKVFYSQQTWASNFTTMNGVQITTSEFREFDPLIESGGQDEKLIWTLPEITLYETHYKVKLLA